MAEEGKEALALPKATVHKIINDLLPADVRCAPETKDLLLKCCTEFIQLVSAEANTACAKSKKKTIAPQHVVTALKSLEFDAYVENTAEELDNVQTQMKENPRRKRDMVKDTGLTREQLLEQQRALFAKARSAYDPAQEAMMAPSLPLAAQASPPPPHAGPSSVVSVPPQQQQQQQQPTPQSASGVADATAAAASALAGAAAADAYDDDYD